MYRDLLIMTLIIIGLLYYNTLTFYNFVIISIISIITLIICKSGGATAADEGFENFDTNRTIHYGDGVTVWSHNNTFMQVDKNGTLTSTASLTSPEAMPHNWIAHHFTIESAKDSRWWLGSRSPVKYGDTIYLRAWNVNWVSSDDNTVVGTNDKRGDHEKLILENPNRTGQYINFGDDIVLKTWNGMYISNPNGKDNYLQVPKIDQSTTFNIYDSYGSGKNINWSVRGHATQSTTLSYRDANSAIDGNETTFSSTTNEPNPWWQVDFPRDIDITNISIINRKDCCQERLKNFTVSLFDHQGNNVWSRVFKDIRKIYNIPLVGRIGRTLRIQLTNKNYLSLAEVKVYGSPVDYSRLLEVPLVADIITKEVPINEGYRKIFYHDVLPYIGKNKSLSLSFFIKPLKNDNKNGVILSLKDLFITLEDNVPVLNVKTESSNDIKKFKSKTALIADQWNHVTIIAKSLLTPEAGWLYGEFIDKSEKDPLGPCCYIVNPKLREYYRLENPGKFSNEIKNEWKSHYVKNMTYKGNLVNNVSSVSIYVNGLISLQNNLDSPVAINNNPMTVGATKDNKAFNGILNMLRYYNYAISDNVVIRDSKLQHNTVSVKLIRGTVDTNSSITVPANKLPPLKSESSVSLWLYTYRPASGSGNSDNIYSSSYSPIMKFDNTSNRLYAPVTVSQSSKTNGIGLTDMEIKPNNWYHVTQVLKDKEQILYVNGIIRARATLSSSVRYGMGPFVIGGFPGKISDLYMHNFALDEDEVNDFMGRHPDYAIHNRINKMWADLGCTTNLFKNPYSDMADRLKELKDDELKNFLEKNKKVNEICYGVSNIPTNDNDNNNDNNDNNEQNTVLDNTTINNIIDSKANISNDKIYQHLISEINKLNDNQKQDDNYQKLIKKLNTMTQSDIEDTSQPTKYLEFIGQINKCKQKQN